MTEREELKPCKCGWRPVVHGAQDMGYLIYHDCDYIKDFRVTDNEYNPVVSAWNKRNDAITPWRPISEYSPEMGEVVVGWAGSDMASTEAFCVGGVWYYECEATSSHEPWDNQPTHFIKLTPPTL